MSKSMTHNELLARINSFTCCSGVHELALLAVVELHKPKKGLEEFCDVCWFVDNDPMLYPCDTIQAIEGELK